MNLPEIDDVNSMSEARELAIDWQDWQASQSMFLSEVAEHQSYFEALADKFPELTEEFKEEGII